MVRPHLRGLQFRNHVAVLVADKIVASAGAKLVGVGALDAVALFFELAACRGRWLKLGGDDRILLFGEGSLCERLVAGLALCRNITSFVAQVRTEIDPTVLCQGLRGQRALSFGRIHPRVRTPRVVFALGAKRQALLGVTEKVMHSTKHIVHQQVVHSGWLQHQVVALDVGAGRLEKQVLVVPNISHHGFAVFVGLATFGPRFQSVASIFDCVPLVDSFFGERIVGRLHLRVIGLVLGGFVFIRDFLCSLHVYRLGRT